MLNPWTIQQLAKAEHARNLKKAEMIRRARGPSLNQKRPNRIICAFLYNIGDLLVSCGLFLQKRCSTAAK
ncbi:MAG: hypothetical protein PVI82_02395 [Desulfobacterales bacterium]